MKENKPKRFYILDDPDLPTFYNHRYFVEKFATGFALNGFKVEVANSVSEIKENSMVMISKHAFVIKDIFDSLMVSKKAISKSLVERAVGFIGNLIHNPRLLKFYLSKRTNTYQRAVNVLKKMSKIKNIVVICWHYQNQRDLLDELGLNYILTGVYYYDEPYTPDAKKWYHLYRTDEKALPIKFAAAVDPNKVGENCSNNIIKVSYVGNRLYGPEYYNLFIKDPACKIVLTPPYIPEKERIKIYKNSIISLGLQKPVKTTIVTERIFESLAYGAICLSNHWLAEKATNGIVKFIKDKEHLIQLVENYVNNRDERLELREMGFKFIKEGHTYKHEAQKFIELANKLYGF
jgi:uncharacterized protein YjiS (DUF1127 family)